MLDDILFSFLDACGLNPLIPSNNFLFITLFKTFFHLSDCSSVLNNTLKSPGYPDSYPINMFCVYRVPIPCDTELVIHFNSFHLENHVFCW